MEIDEIRHCGAKVFVQAWSNRRHPPLCVHAALTT
jgi:hypothetical protein